MTKQGRLFTVLLLLAAVLAHELAIPAASLGRSGWTLTDSMRSSTMSMGQGSNGSREMTCSVYGHQRGTVEAGFQDRMLATWCQARKDAPVYVHVGVQADDPSCYAPIYKSLTVPFRTDVRIGAEGGFAGQLHVNGKVEIWSFGIFSCQGLRTRAGGLIADRISSHISAYLRAYL